MIMANKKPVPLKDEEIDTFDELQDKLQTCINALNSLSSKNSSQPMDSVDVEKFKADVASAAKSAVENLLDDRQKQREEKDKNDKEKFGITQDEYVGTLSERYEIVLSRCEGLLNIIEKERALAFSLNDRYKKSDDCIKVIGKTLDSICEKLGVQAKVGVTQPLMPKTLKEVPSFLLCTIPWYWIRRIWYSRHVRQFALILILCSWALSIGLTLFLARDNADLQKDKKKNTLIRKLTISQPKSAEFVNYVDMVYADEAAHSKEISQLWQQYKSRNNETMDNKIIEQLREEAKDALIHWAKTDKGYFMMKDALEKYIEATGANRSCGNSKETILLGRRIAAQRIVIDAIHLLNKYELYKVDNEMAEIISETKIGNNLRR